jgi:hypothetical protein
MTPVVMSVITFALALVLGDSRATELIAQARAALGGEKAIAKVQGLSATGTVQRLIGDQTVEGQLTFDLQLPDKIVRTDTVSPMGDQTALVTMQGINGDKLLRATRIINAPPGAMIRTPPPPAPGSDAEAQAVRNARAEFARMTVALLLTSPSSLPLEFTSAGQAESPDGKADVIDVKGPNSFGARLFLDTASHRPLMLMYRGVAPRMIVQTQRADAPPPSADAHGSAPALPAGDVVDITLFLDDYRSVDGVQLPHHITRSIDGKPSEELTFKVVKVNPAFKPDTFSGQ